MSKYLLVFATLLFSFVLSAQSDIVIKGSKKITKEMTPQEVIDSLNARFPDANAVAYYKVPASGVNNGWAVTQEDNMTSQDEVDYYTISFTRDNLKYYGLYKKDGTLLNSKIEQTVEALPQPVVNSIMAIAKDYPGWKVKSKTYYKSQNYQKTKEYYEVVAFKNEKIKRLYYEADGTLIKTKDK